jgi:hypothetical protein
MGLFTRAVPTLPDGDYRPVAMPTTDVRVLQVLTRQRAVLRRYSELARVLVPAAGAGDPLIAADQPVTAAEGTSRRTAKIGIGLGVVSAIVKALGADAGLGLSASAASSLEYGYDEVVSDRVDLASLDTWLAGADFRPGLRNITDLIAAEDVYVIVATLKARAVSVSLLDSRQNEVAVDVDAVQAAVGAKVSVAAGGQRGYRLTFRGTTALTVAAKAAQLKFDEDGFWVNQRLASRGEIRGIPGVSYLYLSDQELRLDEG